jgi:HlyD family secretion protein
MKKILPIALALIIAGAVAWSYFQQKTEENATSFTGSGTIEAAEINISSQIAGTVNKITVDEGQLVKKDQVLLVLDDAILKNTLKQAQAGVETAKAAVKDAEDKSSAEKDAAKAQLDSANATLAIAQIQLGYATIKAPIGGTVLDISQNAGENVMPGNNLIMLGDLGDLKIKVFIPENKLGRVKIGQKVSAYVDSFPNEKFEGKIVEISSKPEFTPTNVETKEQRVKLVYQVAVSLENKDGRLTPGMPADIEFSLQS